MVKEMVSNDLNEIKYHCEEKVTPIILSGGIGSRLWPLLQKTTNNFKFF